MVCQTEVDIRATRSGMTGLISDLVPMAISSVLLSFNFNVLSLSVTARVWCRGGIDRKKNSTINLTSVNGACF